MTSCGRAVAAAVAVLAAAALIAPAPAAAKETKWTSFSGGVAPGATIAQIQENGDYYACTLGLIAGDPTTHQLYGITAGHCDHTAQSRSTVYFTDADSPDIARPLGPYTASRTDEGTTSNGGGDLPVYTDAGVIAVQDATPIASFKIAGVYPVRGLIEDRKDLPYGTEVCKYGMRTGETCGPIAVASKYSVTAQLHATHGDSGSPLYRKNSDGSVDLIGLLSNGDSTEVGKNQFFWIAPVLKALHLQACGCGAN